MKISVTLVFALLGFLLIAKGATGLRRGYVNRYIGGNSSRFNSGLYTRMGDGWLSWAYCIFFIGLGGCLILSTVWTFWFNPPVIKE
jgi:hypothetical protein